ncbi:uncharacterized protein F5891DRAFT_1130659 [Suillus fuscotomentosus]|uniref:Uncharacterized protein n=1 Tax=Suillus fuscotomentosus TaxID=1912939 RepID=A0AAD4HG90_9AGAM|nr:uncharacterized protein F5891DRAFT_1130659 [Suillus fuscotomentosus]KAG1895392.1 hypothetical protein F5891DRAFT_1130659 [Suillus fuscotomentosus]
MVMQSFYSQKRGSSTRRVQPPIHQHPKSLQFKNTLDDAWKQLDNATKNIATSHHKNIYRVQNDLYIGRGLIRSKCSKLNLWNAFCWKKNKDKENHDLGKAALQSFVCDNKDEYFALSKEEQDKLLTEFVEFKETKTTSVYTSMKLKINDVMHTLKVVENELNSLHCHMGTETILYTTHGSTDLPLCGLVFATEGIKNFMGTVMGVDNQDLVNKMEGFAVQGMKEQITGDDCAKMQWVIMEEWPKKIPFTNLNLQMLLCKWESGATYWKSLSDEEFEELCKEHKEKLESGELADQRHQPQSDKEKKHAEMRKSTAQCKQFKSAETISDDNSDAEGDKAICEPAAPSGEAIRESAAPSDEAIHESAAPSVVATASASPDTTSPQPLDINLNTLDCNAMLADFERLFGPAPSTLLE